MINFARQLAILTRPYRFRLVMGIIMGILAGFAEPLMIPVVKLVADVVVFPVSSQSETGVSSSTEEPVGNAHKPQTFSQGTLSTLSSNTPAYFHNLLEKIKAKFRNARERNAAGAFLVIVLIPLVMLLRGVLGYLNVYLMQWASIRTIVDLRTRLFIHLTALPMSFFQHAKTGELISRISADTSALQNTLTNSISSLVRDPATLIGVMAYLLWLHWQWTLAAFLIFPACVIPVTIYSRRVRRSSREIQKEFAEISNTMHEAFTGMRVVKAYNLESTVVDRFVAATGRFIGHYMRVIRALEIPGPLIEFMGALGVTGFFLYIGLFANPKPTPGEFLGFILGVFLMYKPVKTLARLHNQFEQARAASERVFELLATKSDLVEPAQPKLLHAAGADIHFDDVTFRYGDKPVLYDINLTIKSGKMVALVGMSGSGKTTVTNLLLRFYDPEQGHVRIGDTDVREVSLRDLRNAIAVVTQETILFNDTIRNNIALGRPGATDPEIVAAAKSANAHEFIMEKPQDYDALIGERGVALSGGQRQRIAIARAILRNAPILVLDEATSSLDSESERAVQGALEHLMVGRTTLCIAHRLSTIQKADQIVVLDKGRIAEIGTHAELLALRGMYSRLRELQAQPEAVPAV